MMQQGLGPYMRASLHDLIFGSDMVTGLDGSQIEGAVDWWDYYSLFLTAAGASKAYASHLDIALRNKTLEQAHYDYDLRGARAVNEVPWSPFQWEVISGRIPGVQEPGEAARCVDDPECLDHLIQIGLGGRPGNEPGAE